MKRLRYENANLDELDGRLLALLAADARASVAALAREVGLSAPSVAERLRRLEEAGVVTGYSVAVDSRALGLALGAWIRIRPLPGQLRKVAALLDGLPEIVECDRITGEDCFLARAQVAAVEDLEALIDEIIPYATTNTSIVQSTPVARRLPPLPTVSG